MTGMFFSGGRIYYTVSGSPRLYYRYFTPESQIVGANLFVASTFPPAGVDWANVRGMTLASGNLYFALANGNLHRVAWDGSAPTGPIAQLGGPGMDGVNWSSRGLFVFSQSSDTLPPTAPGKPSGVSTGFDRIQLTWQASSDASLPITYRIYRDGNPVPIASVQSSSTTTVTFLDSGLVPGSTHTYRVDAVDAVGNVGPLSPVSDPITVLSQDTTPPTTPGTPSGSSSSSSTIDLSWGPSSDASPPITYRIYRDGGASPVGSTTATTFTDSNLSAGSVHTYRVDAVDAVGNVSSMSGTSAPIAVLSAFFADGFSSGDFSSWTSVTRLTIDGTQGAPSPPSARGNPSAQSAFAYRDLSAAQSSACTSVRVNIASQGTTGVDLFRLRSAGNGALIKVFVNQSGVLAIRADFSGAQNSSGVALGSGWHLVELCGTVGSAGVWSLYRDGAQIVTAWTTDTGTAPIARVQIGDTAAKTWTANWDDVVLDGAPG
jgi:chitodextrinase